MTDTPEPGAADLDDKSFTESIIAITEQLRPVAHPVTRDLDRRAADTLLRSYLEPAGFPDAVRRLSVRHLLVLVGEEDMGRRLGAIALLSRMSLAEGRITVLSPAGSAADLLSRTEYGPGRAYLLHDWIAGSTDRTELLNLARKLAELGSYLVITRSGAPSQAVEVEQPWRAPDPGDLFDLYLSSFGGRSVPAGAATARVRALALPTPAEVVRLATRLVRDDEPVGEEVPAWFDTKPPMHEVRAVAALVFAHGLPEPEFARQLAGFERIWQAHEAGPQPTGAPHPLIGVRDGDTVFRVPHHRAQVLGELVARYGFWLWQPLREWVRSLAGQEPGVRLGAAEGVALLAACSLREAQQEFLEVWAQGGPDERLAAGCALSYMCADDALAPEALRLALAWSRDPADPRAVAAAVALCGGLSLRYPADAVSRLWRLAAGQGPAAGVAARALTLLAAQARERDDEHARTMRRLTSEH
ncbi:hypothetical protein ACFFV7_33715 [Nonomuraea spiralis]|uniref:HEAT repeat domain-containing protein n=1 Tax=Nonomuraea spiralis TaxID=46182 RepID=A0ABV5IQ55_9ACTN|nr:hypothetical protein [Nonomuraea spiralis]GGT26372.1 hypothetical protein GCM10010176_083590 [Nonomuraea spiralis]